MKQKFFSRVDRQVAALLSIMLLLFSVFIYLISTRIYYQSIIEGLTNRVDNVHDFIENQLTPDTLLEINSKEDMEKDSYRLLKEQMEEIRTITDLRYLYTAKKNDEGNLVYVVDGLSEDASDFRYPGDLIETEIQPELERALKGETVLPDKILNTDWGNIFIAYYPLHDCEGNIVGALGLELGADVEATALQDLFRSVFLTCLFFCCIAFTVSIIIFRRISNPLYRDMANTDFMTKLKNRNSYETDLNNINARKRRDNITVAVIDINNLKLANDRMGHDIGDNCIINAGKILRDYESNKITAYRYGGDEFVLLMEDQRNPEEMLARIKLSFHKYGSRLRIPVALAVGWAKFDETQDQNLSDTQKRADEFMYQDKMRIKKEEEQAGS